MPKENGFFCRIILIVLEPVSPFNGCYCGGGGKEDKLDVIVDLGRPNDDQ
jgi:hypothetical protein